MLPRTTSIYLYLSIPKYGGSYDRQLISTSYMNIIVIVHNPLNPSPICLLICISHKLPHFNRICKQVLCPGGVL